MNLVLAIYRLGYAELGNPFSKSGCAYSYYFSPLNKAFNFAVMLYCFVCSSVSGLLRSCRPSAVFRAISKFVVDTVDRVVWGWSLAHVTKKIVKTVFPSFAYGNTSSSVSLERIVRRSPAARLDTFPNVVSWCRAASVFARSCATCFKVFFDAPARFCMVVYQRTCSRDYFISTVANTYPVRRARWHCVGPRNNGEGIESATSMVNRFPGHFYPIKCELKG